METHLVFKTDATLPASGGADITVKLSGTGAPQNVKPEEVVSVKGGSIRIAAGDAVASTAAGTSGNTELNQGRTLIPSMFLIAGFIGLIFGFRGNALVLFASFALLFGGAFALSSLNPSWVVTVIITVPSNYRFNSLSIDIARGSVSSDDNIGATISKLNANLCKTTGNKVLLDGFTFAQSASICTTDQLKLNSIVVSDGAAVNVTSTQDSAFVFVKGSYKGSFRLSSDIGYALSSPCDKPTNSNFTARYLAGHCGSTNFGVIISAKFDAVMSLAENRSISEAQRWSNPSTWGGKVPTNGSNIVIESGKVVLLDTTTASLGSLVIKGTLIADPESDFWLIADSIQVTGTLRVGWLSAPYTKNGRFTLTGAQGESTLRGDPLLGWINDGVSRGLRASIGSNLELHGSPPRAVYSRLNENAEKGATQLVIDSIAGWKVGDQIRISPTTFWSTSSTDERVITAIDAQNNKITIDKGLSWGRMGRIQYVTDNGLSFTPGVFKKYRAHEDTPSILDERAVIVHLTRNIVIEAPNDTDWTDKRHGVHVQWMGVTSKIQLNGVEVRRAGQAGMLGRYPLHSHMQSYNLPNGTLGLSDGVFLGDAVDTYIRYCSVHQSVQRALVIHGTCGSRWVNNVAYDIKGHAYFFEDGSEIRNHLVANVVLRVDRLPSELWLLKSDENPGGLWISNPDNHIRHNIVGEVIQGPGFWNSFSSAEYEIAKYVDIVTPSGVTFTPDLYRYGGATPVPFELWTLTSTNATHWKVEGSQHGLLSEVAIKDVGYPNVDRHSVPGIVNFMITGDAPSAGSKITFSIDKYKGQCTGQSRYVRLYPVHTPVTDYYNNTAFACRTTGANTEGRPYDDTGALMGGSFYSSKWGMPDDKYNAPTRAFTTFHNHNFWMNEGGYWSRVDQPLYLNWLLADNRGTDLNGATQYGSKAANMLFIGSSLNPYEPGVVRRTGAKHALATYHFSIIFENMTFFNFPPMPDDIPWTYGARDSIDIPGVLETYELYLSSVEVGAKDKIHNWVYFNCTQPERTLPPHLEYLYLNNPNYNMTGWVGGPELRDRQWSLSGAMYDKEGFFAGVDGDYIIYDVPFLTYNLSSTPRRVGRNISFTLATPDKYGGFYISDTDFQSGTMATACTAQTWQRLDENWNSVGEWKINQGSDDNGNPKMLGWMRHSSPRLNGARYRVFEHQRNSLWSKRFTLKLVEMNSPNDTVIVGFPWDTASVGNPKVTIDGRSIPQLSSRDAMASNPNSYFIETNQIWYHHWGGSNTWGTASLDVTPN